MSRYTGPAFKVSRRLGFSTLETGKEFSKGKKREYAPGQHGQRRRKISNYGTQLAEKQKVRFIYGLSEKQLRKTFSRATKIDSGITGSNFLNLLETRLDNVVYRLGFANTRRGARQLVNHGHVQVNGKKVDIPSYHVEPGNEISIKEKSKNIDSIVESLKSHSKTADFVQMNPKTFSGKFTRYPERTELNQEINESLIVEWYNRLV